MTPAPSDTDARRPDADTPDADTPDADTTRHPRNGIASRVVVPLLCLTAAVAAIAASDRVAPYGHLGPVTAREAALLTALAFVALGLITFLISLIPDATSEPSEPAPAPDADQEHDQPPVDRRTISPVTEASAEKALRDSEKVIDGLKSSLREATHDAARAREQTEAALARATRAEESLAGLRDGTSAEGKELRQQIVRETSDSVTDTLTSVYSRRLAELDDAHDRLQRTWETRITAAEDRATSEADRARRAQEQAQAAEERALAAEQALARAHAETLTEARQRYQIDIEAITASVLETLSEPAAITAIEMHSRRISDALRRLTPEHPAPATPARAATPAAAPEPTPTPTPDPPSPSPGPGARTRRKRPGRQ